MASGGYNAGVRLDTSVREFGGEDGLPVVPQVVAVLEGVDTLEAQPGHGLGGEVAGAVHTHQGDGQLLSQQPGQGVRAFRTDKHNSFYNKHGFHGGR